MLHSVAVVVILAWCGVATYQIWRDWRDQLLPFEATGLATGVGLIGTIATSMTSGGRGFWIGHLAAGAIIGGVATALWWRDWLGLGDVASMAAFGIVFGGIPAVAIITMGYLLTGLGMAVRRIVMGPWPSHIDVPLGPGLWSVAVVTWGLLWGSHMR
ncbi:hypothetical protein [Sulfobacillus sp. hq2]|uniref:hypothetical protein n=1 Tax=Sulfobacillus TaxID=28033 RepID=UPI000CD29DDB|nr:hypothetical protein [Sulfobacillus sp. hq2]POB09662.1 hypothetical protein CO251_15780 [Sulfobacillus sp. hq2]